MNLAVHSDLHTELSQCTLARLETADLLILAGDCGDRDSLPQFFAQLRATAPDLPVLAVLGNHDRWGMDLAEGVAVHRAIAQDYDVRLLDDEAVIFEDVLFCGTTLWTNFALAGDVAAAKTWAQRLPDFRLIRYQGRSFTPDDMEQCFLKSADFLRKTLQKEVDVRKKVVISHFLPARELVAARHGQTQEDLIKSAYWTSDLPELYRLADVWIYGHSHTNIERTVGNTRFVSNQRGYSRYYNRFAAKSGYQPDFFLSI